MKTKLEAIAFIDELRRAITNIGQQVDSIRRQLTVLERELDSRYYDICDGMKGGQ